MELIKIHGDLVVTKEWYNFVSKGILPSDIPEEVLSSWKRSKEMEVNPYGGKSNIILTPKKLNEKFDENQLIINIVKPYMKEMCNSFQFNGYLVFLTDGEGNLLLIDGDRGAIESFRNEINFLVGASWSEEAVGTTAVSLAISTNRPVPFISQQKFCYELKKKSCSAVPITSPNKELLGVLGLASIFPNPNSEIFNLLLSAKRIIESIIEAKMLCQEFSLVSDCYRKMFLSVSDPIIMINNDGIIVDLNDRAKEVIGKVNREIKGSKATDILGYNPSLFRSLNPKAIDSKLNLRKMIPVYDNCNNFRLGIGFLDDSNKKSYEKPCRTRKNTRFCFDDIIGSSPAIEETKRLCTIAARADFNVLLQGKSGTGKELFAQAIHSGSNRFSGPFIAVNCGAIPENLIESEFFGYEGGTFTGASKEGKLGKFELANGGTIFLDEIGDMPKNLQTSLLRVLQEREITRIGGYNPIPIDVRVIAATNKNLGEEVKKGDFREDLYWRLNVITIDIPTLKERQNDIIELLEYFMTKHSKERLLRTKLHPDTKNILKKYDWPGNVRELENLAKRLLVFVDGDEIFPTHLPDYMRDKPIEADITDKSTLEDVENQLIQRTLEENNYNVSETARKLGISRNTIYNRIGVDKISNC